MYCFFQLFGLSTYMLYSTGYCKSVIYSVSGEWGEDSGAYFRQLLVGNSRFKYLPLLTIHKKMLFRYFLILGWVFFSRTSLNYILLTCTTILQHALYPYTFP